MKNMADLQKGYQTALNNFLTNPNINQHNKDILQQFFRDADLDKFNRKINIRRRLKYIEIFAKIDTWFNHKNFEEITPKQFEAWYLDLKNDKILSSTTGKPFKPNSKATFKVAIKTIWKWLKGEGEVFPPEVKSFKNNWEMSKPEALTKSQIEKLAAAMPDIRYRFAVLLLFDSGFRIDEFLSMTKGNFKITTRNTGSGLQEYYLAECIRSKTKPRKVAADLFTATYNDYMREYHRNTPDTAPLIAGRWGGEMTYSSIRKELQRAAKKVFGFAVSPHRIRKSSATFWAGTLKDPFRLNKRMGWTINSDVAQVYIDEAGIPEEETLDVVQVNKAMELEKQMLTMQKKMAEMERQLKLQMVRKKVKI